MPIGTFLKGVFAGKTSDLVDKVGGVIDNLTLSKEEKEKFKLETLNAINSHEEKMAEAYARQFEAEIKEMANARDREIQIATSDKAPLINKIITPILALVVVLSTLVIWALILFRNYEPKVNEAMIIGSLTTLSAGVMSYYFGSSSGSRANQDTINKMASKP